MPDENKQSEPEFKTATEVYDVKRDQPAPTPGMSLSPGLREVDNSPIPGVDRSHVFGPQQSAVDPVLAGLDTNHNPLTRAEDRVITRMSDGAMVVPPPDAESDKIVGPSSISAPAAENALAEASRITPTADAAVASPAEKAAATKAEPANAQAAAAAP